VLMVDIFVLILVAVHCSHGLIAIYSILSVLCHEERC
jgi:hypothetical protein